MKLFLDDVRHPSNCVAYMQARIGSKNPIYLEDWTIVKNYSEFVDVLSKTNGEITHVSFDHDLAEIHYDPSTWREGFEYTEETGEDCAKYMKEWYEKKGLPLPEIFVHSMNPVGTQRIIEVFK